MKKLRFTTILFLFFLINVESNAQFNGSPPPPPPPGDNNGPLPVPLDGGLTALLVAGGAMGYKKLKEKRNDTIE